MMAVAFRKILHRKQLTYVQRFYSMQFSQAATKNEISTHFDKRLPDRIEKKPSKQPFAKNLFLGRFDMDILAFPEVQSHERNKAFFEWLKPIEEYMQNVDAKNIDRTKHIPLEILEQLKELGVFGAKIQEDYGGIELLESEYIKLIETLSLVPTVASYILKINKCVDLIQKNGSVDQKLKFLPKIASGNVIPTICISESKTFSDTKVIKMKAIMSNDDKFWLLNGEKIFVPYANKANLFIIFCLCSHTNDPYKIDDTLSVLFIDEPSNNILSEFVDTVGMRGLPHFNVNFKDVSIPANNIIGDIGSGKNMYLDFFASKKHNTGGLAIGILKNFINLLTQHMIHNKHFNKMLFEYDSAKEVLGKAIHSLYAIESMTYMTTALIDVYNDQDCAIESAMVETFSAIECVRCISESIFLIGTPAYLKENPYELIFKDAQALTMFESSIIDTEMYVALLGLQHMGKVVNEDVKMFRNPFDFPNFNFIDLLYDRKIKLRTGDHLHPSLHECSLMLETAIYKLKKGTTGILVRHGAQIGEFHMDLKRIYEMITLIYCFSTILSRSSRSYCVGLRNAEHEISIANSFAYYVKHRVDQLEQQLQDGNWINGDKNYKQVSQTTLEKKEYFAEHPLTMNY